MFIRSLLTNRLTPKQCDALGRKKIDDRSTDMGTIFCIRDYIIILYY